MIAARARLPVTGVGHQPRRTGVCVAGTTGARPVIVPARAPLPRGGDRRSVRRYARRHTLLSRERPSALPRHSRPEATDAQSARPASTGLSARSAETESRAARQSSSRIDQSTWSWYWPQRRNDLRSTPSCTAPSLRRMPLPRPFCTAARASSRCTPMLVEREVDHHPRRLREHPACPRTASRSRIPTPRSRRPGRAAAPGPGPPPMSMPAGTTAKQT